MAKCVFTAAHQQKRKSKSENQKKKSNGNSHRRPAELEYKGKLSYQIRI